MTTARTTTLQHPMAWVDSQARALGWLKWKEKPGNDLDYRIPSLCQKCLMPEHEGECSPVELLIAQSIKDAIRAKELLHNQPQISHEHDGEPAGTVLPAPVNQKEE